MNIYIEIYGTDRQQLRENEDRLKALCGATGITVESFDHYQKEGYLGICPFGRETRSQRLANNIPSSTFGRLFPFSASSLIDPEGMLLGRTADNGLMSVDIWSRSLMRTNSHSNIFTYFPLVYSCFYSISFTFRHSWKTTFLRVPRLSVAIYVVRKQTAILKDPS